MPYPDFTAGSIVTAGKLNALRWSGVSQVSDSAAVNNSTALVSSAITFSALANATYRYRLLVHYDTTEAADLDTQWLLPASASVSRFHWGLGFSSTGAPNDGTRALAWHLTAGLRAAAGGVSAASKASFHEEGEFVIAGTAGSVTLQFAQRVATVTDTKLLAASKLWYQRVE